jgi:sulfate-transporting ATPase
MAQYVYTMNRVSKTVPPKRQILKDISLSFFPGAKIGVLGLNGSGKSTLLRIMAGLDNEIDGEATPCPASRSATCRRSRSSIPTQTVRQAVEEGIGGVLAAKKRLEEVYAEYADPDADFDKLAPSRPSSRPSSPRPAARTPTCSWRSLPTRCACHRGTP